MDLPPPLEFRAYRHEPPSFMQSPGFHTCQQRSTNRATAPNPKLLQSDPYTQRLTHFLFLEVDTIISLEDSETNMKLLEQVELPPLTSFPRKWSRKESHTFNHQPASLALTCSHAIVGTIELGFMVRLNLSCLIMGATCHM